MITNTLFLLLVGILVAAASGYLGSFMVLKRMSLVGDALSHVALPGMAVAILIGVNPMLGAFFALTIAIIGIWYLAEKSEVYPDALVGVFFTASLAIGILITPEPELFEALFGDLEKVTKVEGWIAILISILVIIVTKIISKKLVIGIVSDDLAKSIAVKTKLVNFIYLFLVGIIVVLGVKFVGTLLTGALVIIPAAASKNISKGIVSYQSISILLGVITSFSGILIAKTLNLPIGPLVVLSGVSLFIISLIFAKK